MLPMLMHLWGRLLSVRPACTAVSSKHPPHAMRPCPDSTRRTYMAHPPHHLHHCRLQRRPPACLQPWRASCHGHGLCHGLCWRSAHQSCSCPCSCPCLWDRCRAVLAQASLSAGLQPSSSGTCPSCLQCLQPAWLQGDPADKLLLSQSACAGHCPAAAVPLLMVDR